MIEWLDNEGRLLSAGRHEIHLGPKGLTVKQRMVAYLSHTNHYVCRLTQIDDRIIINREVVKEAKFIILGIYHISSILSYCTKETCQQ